MMAVMFATIAAWGQCQCSECHPANWAPLSAVMTQAHGRGPTSVSIVVSHCRFRIRWLANVRAELEGCGVAVRATYVYSKCGKADVGAPSDAVVIRLPNVGRCDHSYAHHLAEFGAGLDADVLLFLKDSFLSGSSAEYKMLRMGICGMVQVAWQHGFGCGRSPMPSTLDSGQFGVGEEQRLLPGQRARQRGIIPRRCTQSHSDYHVGALLGEFELPSYAKIHDQRRGLRQKIGFMATHRPLRAWIASVGALLAAAHGLPSNTSSAGAPLELSRRVLARRLQPVCFGGSFAAARSSILSLPPPLWSILRSALARGDNIEESHFMERTWAGLLAATPDEHLSDKLYRAARAIVPLNDSRYWIRGSLDGCTCPES
jgi:hypothetical protein